MASPELIDGAVDLVLAFCEAEHRCEVAGYQRSDDYPALRKAGNQSWSSPKLGIPFLPIHGELDDGDLRQQAALTQRKLYKASEHDHPDLGAVVLCVVSSNSAMDGADRYHERFDVAETDKGLRIVSRYSPCARCRSAGSSGAAPCQDCAGLGWTYVNGVEHPPLGVAKDVRRLEAPLDERYLMAHALAGELAAPAPPLSRGALASDAWTPLLLAVQGAREAEVAALLERADASQEVTPEGHGALHVAIQAAAWRIDRVAPSGGFGDERHARCLRIVQALLKVGVDPDLAKPESAETPLLDAASCGLTDFLPVLVAGGASLERRDGLGRTPLMAASSRGHAAAVDTLLGLGASVDAPWRHGFTALHFAAEAGEVDVALVLARRGADTRAAVTAAFEKHAVGDDARAVAAKNHQRKFVRWWDQTLGGEPTR